MHTRALQVLVFLGTLLLLNACGFQLRGAGSTGTVLPEEWKSMHLVTGNPNSEFARAVITQFEIAGVQWSERAEAKYVLQLGREEFSQRNLSLNAEARAAEFELTMRSRFTVQHADRSIAMEETIASVVKQMENDPRNVVGKSEEVRLLRQEMRAELAQQIMRRIGFFAASTQSQNNLP